MMNEKPMNDEHKNKEDLSLNEGRNVRENKPIQDKMNPAVETSSLPEEKGSETGQSLKAENSFVKEADLKEKRSNDEPLFLTEGKGSEGDFECQKQAHQMSKDQESDQFKSVKSDIETQKDGVDTPDTEPASKKNTAEGMSDINQNPDYCFMIRDLGYLYKEKMIHPITARQIQKHLKTCSECRAYYASLEEPLFGFDQQIHSAEPVDHNRPDPSPYPQPHPSYTSQKETEPTEHGGFVWNPNPRNLPDYDDMESQWPEFRPDNVSQAKSEYDLLNAQNIDRLKSIGYGRSCCGVPDSDHQNIASENRNRIHVEEYNPYHDYTSQDQQILTSVHRRLRLNYLKKGVLGFLLGILALITILGWITVPVYLPLDQAIESVKEANGMNYITFTPAVSNYSIGMIAMDQLPDQYASSSLTDEQSREEGKVDGNQTEPSADHLNQDDQNPNPDFVYEISAWTTPWNIFLEKTYQNRCEVEDNRPVLYAAHNNEADLWIVNPKDGSAKDNSAFGEPAAMMSLPRLTLLPWCILSILISIGSGLMVWIFKKNARLSNIFMHIFLLTLSYCISTFLMTGGRFSSWNLVGDLIFIGSGTVLIDLILEWMISWFRQRKLKADRL